MEAKFPLLQQTQCRPPLSYQPLLLATSPCKDKDKYKYKDKDKVPATAAKLSARVHFPTCQPERPNSQPFSKDKDKDKDKDKKDKGREKDKDRDKAAAHQCRPLLPC